ncbi:hypothetical protein SAMN06309944_2418 [Micrococcales bacterium KH10]|nr:hypothetical protein SAMN06309944_2418 [Micrococcales bacterium KH10]
MKPRKILAATVAALIAISGLVAAAPAQAKTANCGKIPGNVVEKAWKQHVAPDPDAPHRSQYAGTYFNTKLCRVGGDDEITNWRFRILIDKSGRLLASSKTRGNLIDDYRFTSLGRQVTGLVSMSWEWRAQYNLYALTPYVSRLRYTSGTTEVRKGKQGYQELKNGRVRYSERFKLIRKDKKNRTRYTATVKVAETFRSGKRATVSQGTIQFRKGNGKLKKQRFKVKYVGWNKVKRVHYGKKAFLRYRAGVMPPFARN